MYSSTARTSNSPAFECQSLLLRAQHITLHVNNTERTNVGIAERLLPPSLSPCNFGLLKMSVGSLLPWSNPGGNAARVREVIEVIEVIERSMRVREVIEVIERCMAPGGAHPGGTRWQCHCCLYQCIDGRRSKIGCNQEHQFLKRVEKQLHPEARKIQTSFGNRSCGNHYRESARRMSSMMGAGSVTYGRHQHSAKNGMLERLNQKNAGSVASFLTVIK